MVCITNCAEVSAGSRELPIADSRLKLNFLAHAIVSEIFTEEISAIGDSLNRKGQRISSAQFLLHVVDEYYLSSCSNAAIRFLLAGLCVTQSTSVNVASSPQPSCNTRRRCFLKRDDVCKVQSVSTIDFPPLLKKFN